MALYPMDVWTLSGLAMLATDPMVTMAATVAILIMEGVIKNVQEWVSTYWGHLPYNMIIATPPATPIGSELKLDCFHVLYLL